MSNSDTTVVICCAGMGTRLGIGTTKALLHIGGKPLIIHQLENLDSYNDVRIVVGYQADKVIETVNTYRKDVMFCFNNEYQTTSPSMSRVKGAINSKKYILAIDGDVLINPNDFQQMLEINGEHLAVSKKNSEEPDLVTVNNGTAQYFSESGNFEWPGIVKIESENLIKNNGEVENIFPVTAFLIRTRDIDTQDDYDNAIKWFQNGYC